MIRFVIAPQRFTARNSESSCSLGRDNAELRRAAEPATRSEPRLTASCLKDGRPSVAFNEMLHLQLSAAPSPTHSIYRFSRGAERASSDALDPHSSTPTLVSAVAFSMPRLPLSASPLFSSPLRCLLRSPSLSWRGRLVQHSFHLHPIHPDSFWLLSLSTIAGVIQQTPCAVHFQLRYCRPVIPYCKKPASIAGLRILSAPRRHSWFGHIPKQACPAPSSGQEVLQSLADVTPS